jgi:ABC-2 type transport system permease protein
VTPVTRPALLLGRVLRDAALFVFQAALLTVAAVVMGLRAPIAGVLIGFAFVAVLSAALASLSYALATKAPTPQAFGPVVNAVTMPTMLLSGLVLPMALAPAWLDALSHVMPLRYLVDAMRSAFTGDYATSSLSRGAVAAAVLLVVSVTLGVRVFSRPGA